MNLYFPSESVLRIRKVKVLRKINFWVLTERVTAAEAEYGEEREEGCSGCLKQSSLYPYSI